MNGKVVGLSAGLTAAAITSEGDVFVWDNPRSGQLWSGPKPFQLDQLLSLVGSLLN